MEKNIEIAKLAVELVKLNINDDIAKYKNVYESIEDLFEKYFEKIKKTIDNN